MLLTEILEKITNEKLKEHLLLFKKQEFLLKMFL